jgi:hypothetical protein
MIKQRTWWIVVWLFLLCGISLFGLSRFLLAGGEAKASFPFVQESLYVSPDGNWALISSDTEDGEDFLYSITQRRIVRRFDSNYVVPSVGHHMWSHDSKRFLIMRYAEATDSDEPKTVYEVWEPRGRKPKQLHIPGDPQGLTALISPDGQYVAAEIDEGVLVWNVATNGQKFFEFALEDYLSLYGLTWIGSEHLLLRFGAQKPKLAIVDIKRGTIQPLEHSIDEPFYSFVYAESLKAIPILFKNSPQSTALFDGTTGTIYKRNTIALDGIIEPTDSQVNRVKDEAARVEFPQPWYWSSNCSSLPALWRQKSPEIVEWALYDAKEGRVVSSFEVSIGRRSSVDKQGRVWGWDGSDVKLIGGLR